MKRGGFTLIELLIVISIIAVLTTAALVFYQEFNKRARDSKRQSDLKIIQSALEDYHADQIYYPASVTPGGNLSAGGKTYLNQVSNDPKGTPNYQYKAYKWNLGRTDYIDCVEADNAPASTNKCVKYCLFAQTEGTAPSSDSGCTTFPACGTGCTYNYGVTRP